MSAEEFALTSEQLSERRTELAERLGVAADTAEALLLARKEGLR